MKFKKIKKFLAILLISLCIIPQTALAYSSYIIPGGEAVGISLNSKGILIVGFYEVNGNNPGNSAGLKIGDTIKAINGKEISTISEMVSLISSAKDKINIKYERNGREYETTLELVIGEDNVYKTGLYVKDSITGLGTLTFIDPATKIYGTLGHEITEKSTGLKLEVKNGKIFEASITGIVKTERGVPGEKNAKFFSSNTYGTVTENTNKGVFGTYTAKLPDKKALKVASKDEIKLGDAKILTALDGNNVEEFNIKITKINSNSNQETKNIVFEITDEKLLNRTGGVVQGMSGSPIIQNDMIIGAVTHVVVDNPSKGYGIFITNMLEEAEN